MARVREYKIQTLASFLALLEREKRVEENRGRKADFLFRGQDVDEPLVPTLARRRLRGALPNIERLMLNEFERVTPPLRELPINNDWDLLAVAQHYGLPTRLLDWTFSATAALWFVVRNPPARDVKSKPRDGVVWVLKPSTDDFVDIRTKETPFEGKRTRIFRPAVIARRIAAQAGVFTVHKLLAGKRLSHSRETVSSQLSLRRFMYPPALSRRGLVKKCVNEIRREPSPRAGSLHVRR